MHVEHGRSWVPRSVPTGEMCALLCWGEQIRVTELTMSQMDSKEEVMEDLPTQAPKQSGRHGERTGDLWGPRSILPESSPE